MEARGQGLGVRLVEVVYLLVYGAGDAGREPGV